MIDSSGLLSTPLPPPLKLLPSLQAMADKMGVTRRRGKPAARAAMRSCV